jgi:hypothetical protein
VKLGPPASPSDGVAFAGFAAAAPDRDETEREPDRIEEATRTLFTRDVAVTLARGSARLVDGVARIPLGVPGVGLTAHLTPRAAPAELHIVSLDSRELVVRGRDGADTEFDYVVLGPRATRDASSVTAVAEPAEAGDVVALLPDRPGALGLARAADDSGVFGVVDDELGVAVSGVVACKVDADYGAIRAGDLLGTSYTPGHARRLTDPRPGTILGKALEPLAAGRGVVRMLVMLR